MDEDVTPDGLINWIRRPQISVFLIVKGNQARVPENPDEHFYHLPLKIFYRIQDAYDFMAKTESLKKFKITPQDRQRMVSMNQRVGGGKGGPHYYKLLTKWMSDKSNSEAYYLVETSIW